MGYIGQAPASKVVTSADIEDGVVSAADLGANSVDSSELVDGSVDIAHLSASGTASSSNFLRGDNAWTAVSGFDVSSITGATALGATPADTDEFVLSDAGTLKRVDYSYLKSLFGSVGFAARLSSSFALDDATSTDVVFNTEILDTNSAYNTSTGEFTVPVAGKYMIGCNLCYNDGEGNMSDMQTVLHIAGGYGQIHRAESVSNGTTHSELTKSWSMIISDLSVSDVLKITAYADTNNGTTTLMKASDYSSCFWGWNLV